MGYEIIQDYFADEKNVELTRSVMLEVAALLEAKHGFTHQEMLDYVNFAIIRFLTPGISDPISVFPEHQFVNWDMKTVWLDLHTSVKNVDWKMIRS